VFPERTFRVTHARLLILGSGPAGWTAALYGARANLEPVVVTGIQPGGQLTITTDVENYPGFAETIQGPWLMEEMRKQAERFRTRVIEDTIVEADLSGRPFRLKSDLGQTYLADALVIATGAQAKWLGIPGEERFKGYGVSACATCDGFFFKNREVVVIGGGNTAVEEALYLSQIARKVTVIHRRDSFRAERILQDRLFAAPNIEVMWNTVVEDILGAAMPPKVETLVLRNTRTNAVSEWRTEGVFVAIGHAPATELFRGQLDLDPAGYIKVVPGTVSTAIPGVFAAGDVADPIYRQAVTAAGMGCMAALDAERFLAMGEVRRDAAE
jgi:thioredoxin reductase (NADPH)